MKNSSNKILNGAGTYMGKLLANKPWIFRISAWALFSGAFLLVVLEMGWIRLDLTSAQERPLSVAQEKLQTAFEASVQKSSAITSEENSNLIFAEPTIRIPDIGIESKVIFPKGRETWRLADALTKGVVHYPDSALPSEVSGNVFLFGHSSKYKEKNPAYSAFSNLGKAVPGQKVEFWYEEKVYVYKTTRVRILKPGEAEVYFASDKRKITLSTCWPLGDPERRFILEAEFIGSYPQGNY